MVINVKKEAYIMGIDLLGSGKQVTSVQFI